MSGDDSARRAREAHQAFERARRRVWLDRVKAGIEHRRALRAIDEGVLRARLERDRLVREAVAAGSSYRALGRELGLSHSRIQQIVNEERGAADGSRGGADPR